MPIKYVKFITREMVQAEPDARFVFGDNLARVGLGGQAGAVRGEPNAIGVATKRAPGMADGDFFTDTADCRDAVLADLRAVRKAIDEDLIVYVPADGLGTGLSELPTRAPKLAQLLVDTFRRFDGEPCPWPDVIDYDPDGLAAVKGFGADLSCSPADGQRVEYAIGGTYEMDGPIAACERGYHACLHPLDVFGYYVPAGSRFAAVKMSGAMGFHSDDTKVAAARITVVAEIGIPEIVSRAIKWVSDRAFPETGSSATGTRGAASATGKHSVACALGYDCKAMADETGAIVLVRRDGMTGAIEAIFASKVGENGIEADVWYVLGADGKPVEVAA